MAKLKEDFPHFNTLEAAGITTDAQLRKAMEAEDWPDGVTGIGPVAAEEISKFLEKGKAESDDDETDDPQLTGTDDDKLTSLETTALGPPPKPKEEDNSIAGRLVRSGYVLNENQITGERYVGETIQKCETATQADRLNTRVTSIAEIPPRKGLTVKPIDGEPFVVGEEFDRDSTPASWFAVINPATQQPFIS